MVSHHPLSQFFRVFLKASFSVLYFLFFIPLPSALSSPTHLSNINSTLITLNSSFLFLPLISRKILLTLKQLFDTVSTWMSANLLSINQSKTEFLLIGLPKQLAKVSDPNLLMPSNVTITSSDTARILGVIFDSSLTVYDHISSISKSCFLSIRDLRRIRNTINLTTAKTIATSLLIHSKVDYCNSLYLNLHRTQLDRLQLIINSAARAVDRTPRFTHISPVLKALRWLKIDQRIHFKIVSITYKTLQSRNPSYLHNLLQVQSCMSTRSSASITLTRPVVSSRLKITNRSFTHQAPILWNALPKELRQPIVHSSQPDKLYSTAPPILALFTSKFHSELKTHLFQKSSPP